MNGRLAREGGVTLSSSSGTGSPRRQRPRMDELLREERRGGRREEMKEERGAPGVPLTACRTVVAIRVATGKF